MYLPASVLLQYRLANHITILWQKLYYRGPRALCPLPTTSIQKNEGYRIYHWRIPCRCTGSRRRSFECMSPRLWAKTGRFSEAPSPVRIQDEHSGRHLIRMTAAAEGDRPAVEWSHYENSKLALR
ncbi:hypothetical protein EVAR_22895_1 [Eumeta japonica]|uniref:Uncharacterized protein n=1 Tax=Eumeta variegata TaxID=151549 RepID=A0A4C1UU83_EUMVA|nr:hypothetical protein EVAR_22895_1 [Eumeta japonica]